MSIRSIDCPVCDGNQKLEYERPVIDYQRGGYLEGYLDDCQYCEGSGEVYFDNAEDRLHHYKVKKGIISPW